MPANEIKVIKLTLAAIWLITGLLSLGIYPVENSLALLARVGITGTYCWSAPALAVRFTCILFTGRATYMR